MSRHAVVVSFTLKPGAWDTFLALVKDNAAISVREEPGCFRFDVMTATDGDEVLLYEIYADAAAFERHLATAHFKTFDAATRDLVVAKTVKRYSVSENARG